MIYIYIRFHKIVSVSLNFVGEIGTDAYEFDHSFASSRAPIQYKDVVLPVKEIPFWR